MSTSSSTPSISSTPSSSATPPAESTSPTTRLISSPNARAIAIASVAVVLSIIAIVMHFVFGFPPYNQFLFWFAMILLMAGLFPFSAIAFAWLEVPGIVEQISNDIKLTGVDRTLDRMFEPSAKQWSHTSYAFHYFPAILATVLGVSLFFGVSQSMSDGLLGANTLNAMRWGFLGAYVYCMRLVYRRYTTLDLQPHVYMCCAIGMMAGMMFNFVAFSAIDNMAIAMMPAAPAAVSNSAVDGGAKKPPANETPAPATTTSGSSVTGSTAVKPTEFTGIGAGAAAILAFSLGFFPNLAINWFARLSHTAFRERQRRSDELPLSLLDGISELHETRLRDAGIDNIQNLASANIRDLIVKTPFPASAIVEWIDQAVLYLYLDPGEIGSFRKAGARCVSDFEDLWGDFYVNYDMGPNGTVNRSPDLSNAAGAETEFSKLRKATAQLMQSTEERLDALYCATLRGPNMDYVRTYWSNIEDMAKRSRMRVISQICGRVGCALRDCSRRGGNVASEQLLKLVVQSLLSDDSAKMKGKAASEITAESLYGEAWLNQLIDEHLESQRLYEKCIEDYPHDPDAFNDLAFLILYTLKDKSLYKRALQYADTAVKIAENGDENLKTSLPGYLDTLALAQICTRSPKEGMETIDKAIAAWTEVNDEKQLKFGETMLAAAEMYILLKKNNEAKEVLDRIIREEYADKSTKEKVLELLKKIPASTAVSPPPTSAAAPPTAVTPPPDSATPLTTSVTPPPDSVTPTAATSPASASPAPAAPPDQAVPPPSP